MNNHSRLLLITDTLMDYFRAIKSRCGREVRCAITSKRWLASAAGLSRMTGIKFFPPIKIYVMQVVLLFCCVHEWRGTSHKMSLALCVSLLFFHSSTDNHRSEKTRTLLLFLRPSRGRAQTVSELGTRLGSVQSVPSPISGPVNIHAGYAKQQIGRIGSFVLAFIKKWMGDIELYSTSWFHNRIYEFTNAIRLDSYY